jgi:DNA-binding beta-propeller fold protein YncE
MTLCAHRRAEDASVIGRKKMIIAKRMDGPVRRWTEVAGLLAVVVLAMSFWLVNSARAAVDCSPANGVTFICGVTNVEDWAPVPGTKWIIGSDLSTPSSPQGYLYLFDTGKKSVSAVQPSEIAIRPDKKTFPDCPGPVDMKTFGPHGLDLTRTGGAHRVLYAVNHGGRESVEVFNVDLSGVRPRFTWTGCVVAPKGFWPDAVASVANGGIVVTSLWDPTDADRLAKLSKGQPVGALDEWDPGKGWSVVAGTEGMSGPNGVIVSPDGTKIYLALWSGKEVARIDRSSTPPKVDTVPTDILADNVRWSPTGKSIFVGGQDVTVKQVLVCFESSSANCNVPFKIYRLDPATLKLTEVVKSGVYGVMGGGTGAVQVGNKVWVSSFRADRIGIFPAK